MLTQQYLLPLADELVRANFIERAALKQAA